MILLQLFVFALLGVIAFEDFKNRAIHWWLLPALAIGLWLWFYQEERFPSLIHVYINFGFIGVQLLVLTIYFSIKNRAFVNLSNELLGLGDILFFVVIAPLFPFSQFLTYFLCSLLIALLTGIIFRQKTIPLAGIMAISLAVFIAIQHQDFLNLSFLIHQ